MKKPEVTTCWQPFETFFLKPGDTVLLLFLDNEVQLGHFYSNTMWTGPEGDKEAWTFKMQNIKLVARIALNIPKKKKWWCR